MIFMLWFTVPSHKPLLAPVLLSPSQRREAPCEVTNSPQLFTPQEAQALFARARLCLPYNEGRKETLRPK